VERTGAVAPNATAWTTIPGLTTTITLTLSSLVELTGSGVQRTTDMNAATVCHIGYRYVIDGVARGDATWGQRIQVSSGATSWHQTWSITDGVTLAAGAHKIAIQAFNPAPYGNCYVCGENNGTTPGYDTCTLQAVAVPQ
jgi:hypothetical protein